MTHIPDEIEIRNSIDHLRGMIAMLRNIPNLRDYDRACLDSMIEMLDGRGDLPDPSNGRAAGWYECTGCGWLFYRTLTDSWSHVIDHSDSRSRNWQWGPGPITWAPLCEEYADCAGKIVPLLPLRSMRSTEEA